METCTIVIQGPLNRNKNNLLKNINICLEYNCPVVVSCYETCDENIIKDLPIRIIKSQEPEYNESYGNLKKQIVSTLNGLKEVKTEFALKSRSDEFYENLNPFFEAIQEYPNKLITSNIFFIPPLQQHELYHISDHECLAKTDNILRGFELALLNLPKFKSLNLSIEGYLFINYLTANGIKISLDEKTSRELTKKHAFCIDISKCIRYNFVCGNKTYDDDKYLYFNDFNKSVKNINEL